MFYRRQRKPVSKTMRGDYRLLLRTVIMSWSLYMYKTSGQQRKFVQIDGDIIIGALFPVHEQPTIDSAFTRQCGKIREQYGMHRVEALIKAIRDINADPTLLPNITLGTDIRDTCWYAPVALEQSIDFIRNSLAYMDSGDHDEPSPTGENGQSRGNQQKQCDKRIGKPIAALIGPASSSVTIQVQNLLQLFKIPQIGYSATSIDLSGKDEYKYFLRVVPPDDLQARAMMDVIRALNWTYISLLHSKGNYGARGMQEFKYHLERQRKVCTDQDLDIDNKEDSSEFDIIASKLFNHTNPAKVVVCFCQGETVKNLFLSMQRLQFNNRGFLIFGSDGWGDRPDVIGEQVDPKTHKRERSEVAAGGLSIRLHSPIVPGFDEYFWNRKPSANDVNPWFKEFWEQKFNCAFDNSRAINLKKNMCTGKESLNTSDYAQDSKLGFVVNSLKTLALGLHEMQQAVCNGTIGRCSNFPPVNGSLLLSHLTNVSFQTYANDSLHFDSKGDPPGRYDIMNYHSWPTSDSAVKYGYKRIARWNLGRLTLDDSIKWPNDGKLKQHKVQSFCSQPCGVGEIKIISIKTKPCCWNCKSCQPNEITVFDEPEERCAPCENGKKPTEDRLGCELMDVEFIRWSDTQAVVGVTFSCGGILVTLGIFMVLVRNNNTPVVKSSTRELMYIILVGITLSYSTTFVLIAKPTTATCFLTRVMPGLSFALIYGSLVVKTNRIARILAGSKKKITTRKPRFLSTSSQIIITIIIVTIEIAIIAGAMVLEPAYAEEDYSVLFRVFLKCNTTFKGVMVPLGFDMVLIMLCTVYAIRTRNLPANFNEAKFIGFTMYTTCIIWIGFVPIYVGSDHKVLSMCIAMSASASVALVLLFFPKLYVMVCKPEENNRSHFTTSTEIRCHIGAGQGGGRNSAQPRPFEKAALSVARQKSVIDKWRRQSTNPSATGSGGSVTVHFSDGSDQHLLHKPPAQTRPRSHSSAEAMTLAHRSGTVAPDSDRDLDSTTAMKSIDSGGSAQHYDFCGQTDSNLMLAYMYQIWREHCAQQRHPPRFVSDTNITNSKHSRGGFGVNSAAESMHCTCDYPFRLPHEATNNILHVAGHVGRRKTSDTTTSKSSTNHDEVGLLIQRGLAKPRSMSLSPNANSHDDMVTHSRTLTQFPAPIIANHSIPVTRRTKTRQPEENGLQLLAPFMAIGEPLSSSSNVHTVSSYLSNLSQSSSSDRQLANNVSLEDMSVLGLKFLDDEDEQTASFRRYLQQRGLDIDLDNIQTSEV